MVGRNVAKLVVGLLLIALLGGAGVLAYDAGMAQGMAQAGSSAAPVAGAAPYPYYGPSGPFFHGFGFLGLLFPLAFFFLFVGLVKAAFSGHAWGHRGGGWGHHMTLDDWHQRMHEPKREAGAEPTSQV